MHDGSVVVLKKLEQVYDPTDRWQALEILEDAERHNWLITGLIYVNPEQPSLYDYMDLVDQPLNRIKSDDLRPSPDMLEKINANMY
jgi:2-oxoglutarate ferredoxin oxidoreductase subunit beta